MLSVANKAINLRKKIAIGCNIRNTIFVGQTICNAVVHQFKQSLISGKLKTLYCQALPEIA
jgi:hypothetical protein